MLELSDHLRQHLPPGQEFDTIMALRGEIVREQKNRRTMRVTISGRDYFLKTHGPISLDEFFKNAIRGRWPVLDSRPEWNAIKRLEELGVPTTPAAGIGVRGIWPLRLESFLLTEALPNMIHLSEMPPILRGLPLRVRTRLRLAITHQLARISRTLHTHGLNHRDFYLCHFMLPQQDWTRWTPGHDLAIRVIDLHRMQIRSRTPRRWLIKDISGLLFSALDSGMTSRDYLRFLRDYWAEDWRTKWNATRGWRTTVIRRAISLYRSEHGRSPRHAAIRASSA